MGIETQFIRHGDVQVACTVPEGDGPNLLWASDWMTPIEAVDQVPPFRDFFARFASFSRFATYDPPGTGSSDSIVLDPAPGLDYWLDTAVSVLDGLGWERAVVAAHSLSSTVAVALASTYPDRVSRLVLAQPYVGSDIDGTSLDSMAEVYARTYGTPAFARLITPELADDAEFARRLSRMYRQSLRPAAIRSLFRSMWTFDVRNLIPSLECPVLILTNANEFATKSVAGVPNATFVQLPGDELFPQTPEQIERWIVEIQRFVTGEAKPVQLNRQLTTVLFTDIVSSTGNTATKGDHGWRDVLDRHDEISRERVMRYGGHIVKSMGDGILATLDSPARAVRCSQSLRDVVRDLGIEIRCGLHTGEIELRSKDIGGTAVNIARRVCDSAEANEVRVSETVTQVVAGSGLKFDDLGPHDLKGVPGTWRLFRARD